MTNYMNVPCGIVVQHSVLYNCAPIRKEELVNKIQGMHLEQMLIIISKLIALNTAMLLGNQEAINNYNALKFRYYNTNVYLIQEKEHFDVAFLFSLQSLYMAYKWLLAYGVERPTEDIHEIHVAEILEAVNLCIYLADFLPQDIEGNENEYCYANLYHNTLKSVKNDIARTFSIFANLQAEESQGTDYLGDFEKYYKFSVVDYLSVTFNFMDLPLKTNDFFGSPYLIKCKDFDAKMLNEQFEKYVNEFSIPINAAQKKSLETIDQPWNYEFMYNFPLLRVGDSILPFSYAALVYLFFEGLYWRIRFAYKTDSDVKRFFRTFGRPFERYVQEITEKTVGNNHNYRFINEFKYTYGTERLSSDCYIIKENEMIIVECKAKSPLFSTVKGYDLNAIENETIDLLVGPVWQVDSRLGEILTLDEYKESMGNTKNIFVVVVTMEKLQPIPYVYEYAKKYLSGDAGMVIYNEEEIEPRIKNNICGFVNLNVNDYEQLCGLIDNGIDIYPLLEEYCKGPIKPFANFISEHNLDKYTSKYIESKLQSALDSFFSNTFGTIA